VFRLKGHGMPSLGRAAGDHGDLYATVEVRVPSTVSPEERTHYEALAELERRKKHPAA
jgi:DnaJ-class molecular chaperone